MKIALIRIYCGLENVCFLDVTLHCIDGVQACGRVVNNMEDWLPIYTAHIVEVARA